MKSERIEAILKYVKDYKSSDVEFMTIYTKYTNENATEGEKTEALTSLFEYLDDGNIIPPE